LPYFRSQEKKSPSDCDVIVAGSGIAACACALRLLAAGFHPLLVSSGRAIQAGAEAIAEPALELFAELGLERALKSAGAEIFTGFDNAWHASAPHLKPGRWIHVDRRALASAALEEAVACGALLHVCNALPRLQFDDSSVRVRLENEDLDFIAALDASGRSAVWSRPLQRLGNEVAAMFHLQNPCPGPGKIVRTEDGWAFFIGSTTIPTVGVVGPARRTLDGAVKTRLGVCGGINFAGHRPAFAQWCQHPVAHRRLAVGDAALAYSPLAGQGIRFALATAYSAGAVIRTWRDDPSATAAAEEYYCRFVDSARLRHLAFLAELRGGEQRWQEVTALPELVHFVAHIHRGELMRDSRITREDVIAMPDGEAARWVGGFDLLRLKDLAHAPVRTMKLIQQLHETPMTEEHAYMLIRWCLERRILSAETSEHVAVSP
jgi:flavin-dependent dehydrogenase